MKTLTLEDVAVTVLAARADLTLDHARQQVTGFAALDHDVPLDVGDAMRFEVSRSDGDAIVGAILDPANHPH